jgi:predicted anti-sigma-YlaC factor YlaD
MSRMHRLGRRAGQATIAHDRARTLAATRVDWPLDPRDAAWLDAHLSSCESCRSVAAAYGADRLALRSLRDQQPEPPRDLWARTAAAIEGESAARRSTRRRASAGRRSVPLGALSGIAVIVVVIGASVLSGGFLTGRTGDGQDGNPPIAAVPTTRAPGATPMAVGVGSVEWLGTSSTGGLAYNTTTIDKVCLTDRQPDCEPVNDRDSKQVALSIRPKSISQSPVKNQAVVVGTDAAGSDSVVVLSLPTPQPTSTPIPSPTPVATATPSLTPEPTETPVASGSTAASSEPSESASLEPSATPEVTPPASVEPSVEPTVQPSVEPTPEATPILTPEPTVSANLAIISGVKVVGQSAAYSPDGAWFAFTARPSDGSEGPDIYVWRVGDLLAKVATSDHASVFASWAGDRLIGSRVAAGATESFFIDPDSGDQSTIDGSVWRPAVDPGEHWAVTWDGTVTVSTDNKTPVVGDGSLVLRGFSDANGVDTTGKPAAVVAKGPFAEFDVRWDETGSWLAVWVADGNDPSIGRLSLLQVDPVTGELDRPHGAPRDMPALPGFSIANGRLAWATPPGQGGEGSRVQVVAWTDDSVGAVESGPVENVVVIH